MHFKQFNKITLDKNIELHECADCGRIFWSAKDICELLEIKDVELELSRLDPDMKDLIVSCSNEEDADLSEPPKIDVLTTKGVLALLFQSETTFGKYIQRWFTDEVLENAVLARLKLRELGYFLPR